MNKTTEQLNADTLFALQMALKGHNQFEFRHTNGSWSITSIVSSSSPCRIYHDIPDGWTRHDGGDYPGKQDDAIESVMFFNGHKTEAKKAASYYSVSGYWKHDSPHHRIYAYKLAAKSPEIPEGFTAHNGGKCPIAGDLRVKAIRISGSDYEGIAKLVCWTDIIAYRVIEKKVIPWEFNTRPKEPTFVYRKGYITDSMIVAWGDDVVVIATKHGLIKVTYDELLSDWLRSGGIVCGKEVDESCTCASGSLGATQCKIHNGEAK